MKKFLLSLAAVALASSAMAATDTFDFVNNTYGLSERGGSSYDKEFTITQGDVTMKAESGSTSSGYRLWTDGLRIYKGEVSFTLTAKDANIKEVVVTYAGSPGTLKVDGTAVTIASNKSTWTGDAAAPKFVYTVTANKAIATIAVTYEAALSGDQKPAGLEYAETAFTVKNGDTFTAPALTNPNNLAVTYTSTNPAVATVASNGAVTIVGAGTTTIEATSASSAEFGAGYAAYTITVVNAATTIAKMLAAVNVAGDKVLVDFPMTVIYVNGLYCYVEQGTYNTLIYGDYGYKKGDVIPAGWVAEYAPYGGMAEFKMQTSPAASGTDTVSYGVTDEVNASMVNRVLIINNVTFADATPADKTNFTGTTADGAAVTFRNNFTVASVAAGTYNVTAAVGIYNGTVQVYPIEYTVKPVVAKDGFVTPSANAKNFTCVYEKNWAENDDLNTYVVTCDASSAVTFTITIPEDYNECYLLSHEAAVWDDVLATRSGIPADFLIDYFKTYMGLTMVKADSFSLAPRDNHYEFTVLFGNNGEIDESIMNDMDSLPRLYITINKVEGTVGVEAIEAEGAAEYFNLNGVRVANPENGIFVKVVNGKATKVIR